jgi:hypothetical protein
MRKKNNIFMYLYAVFVCNILFNIKEREKGRVLCINKEGRREEDFTLL